MNSGVSATKNIHPQDSWLMNGGPRSSLFLPKNVSKITSFLLMKYVVKHKSAKLL